MPKVSVVIPAFNEAERLPATIEHIRNAFAASSGIAADFDISVCDMDELLDDDPRIIVGHSLGGVVGGLYAQQNTEHISGVISVDAVPGAPHDYFGEEWFDGINPAIRIRKVVSFFGLDALFVRIMTGERPGPGLRTFESWTEHVSAINDPDIVDQLNAVASLGDIPVIVMEAGSAESFEEQYSYLDSQRLERLRTWLHDGQLRLATLSTDAEYVLAESSGHNIPEDVPNAIADAIRKMLERSRVE